MGEQGQHQCQGEGPARLFEEVDECDEYELFDPGGVDEGGVPVFECEFVCEECIWYVVLVPFFGFCYCVERRVIASVLRLC